MTSSTPASPEERAAKRVRIRLDLPGQHVAFYTKLQRAAKLRRTSVSQLGMLLLAAGLRALFRGELDEYLGTHLFESRALRIAVDVDSGDMLRAVTKMTDPEE